MLRRQQTAVLSRRRNQYIVFLVFVAFVSLLQYSGVPIFGSNAPFSSTLPSDELNTNKVHQFDKYKNYTRTKWDLVPPERIWLPTAGNLLENQHPAYKKYDPTHSIPRVCIVARTYIGQSPEFSPYSLDRFIASILVQSNPNWNLVLIDTSAETFVYLHSNVSQFARSEPRIQIVPSISHYKLPPNLQDIKVLNELQKTVLSIYASDPHTRFYYVSDMVLREYCPKSTEYVILTNGDNWYHPETVEIILTQTSGADAIGFDFASRYQTYGDPLNGKPRNCATIKDLEPHCAVNQFKPKHFDVGAVALNYTRLIQENRFWFNSTYGCEVSGSHDGCFIESLPWKKARIPMCLLAHSPSIEQCRMYGADVHIISTITLIECVEKNTTHDDWRWKPLLLAGDFMCYGP